MRLKNIYLICKENCESIEKSNTSKVTHAGSEYIRLTNWGDMFTALDNISKIEYLNVYVEEIFQISPVLLMGKGTVDLDSIQYDKFERWRHGLYVKLTNIIELFESIYSVEGDAGFDVKLPEFSQLSEFLCYIKTLNFIFESPYLLDVKECMTFDKVDLGSTWLVFTAIAAGATKILEKLAKIVDKAMIVYSHNLNCKMQKENLRTLGIQNDFLEKMTDQFNKASEVIVDNCLSDLEKDLGELSNGEERDKTKRAIEKLADLFAVGLRINASIETDSSIQVLFPTEEKYKLSDTPRKFLEMNGDDDED